MKTGCDCTPSSLEWAENKFIYDVPVASMQSPTGETAFQQRPLYTAVDRSTFDSTSPSGHLAVQSKTRAVKEAVDFAVSKQRQRAQSVLEEGLVLRDLFLGRCNVTSNRPKR